MVLYGLIWFSLVLYGLYNMHGFNNGILMEIPSGYVKTAIEASYSWFIH